MGETKVLDDKAVLVVAGITDREAGVVAGALAVNDRDGIAVIGVVVRTVLDTVAAGSGNWTTVFEDWIGAKTLGEIGWLGATAVCWAGAR